jgi:hypothetical protein
MQFNPDFQRTKSPIEMQVCNPLRNSYTPSIVRRFKIHAQSNQQSDLA